MASRKVIISSGEPAGIGPDITIKAMSQSLKGAIAVLGDPELFQRRAKQINVDVNLSILDHPSQVKQHIPGLVQIIPVKTRQLPKPGNLNRQNSQYVLNMVNHAVDYCLNSDFDAMVTAPIQKSIINDAGIVFSGHTEWIAERTKSVQPVMMLVNERLRVCLVTTHLPLNKVAQYITQDKIESVLHVLHRDLKKLYKLPSPVIGVCGLNPHAGENGHFGTEELNIISPVIKKLSKQKMKLVGPLPADTAFTQSTLSTLDAILTMYHDQGLPVIKHSSFGEVVNVTLGLPIIRTSVDHGTALDLAGTGMASEQSLVTAIKLALQYIE